MDPQIGVVLADLVRVTMCAKDDTFMNMPRLINNRIRRKLRWKLINGYFLEASVVGTKHAS